MSASQRARIMIGVFTIFLLTRGLLPTSAQEPLNSGDQVEMSVTELLQKRRAILLELVKVQTEAYQQGKAQIDAVFQAQQELLRVNLELATSEEMRINLLEEASHLSAEFQKSAEAKYSAGLATQADVLKSQSETLRAKTDLLRARQRARKPKGN